MQENQENVENKERIIGHYSTRGGRYQIMVYEKPNEYSYRTFKQLDCDGSGHGYTSKNQIAGSIARMIYFAKKIDGINYCPVIELPEISAILSV